MMSLPGTEDFPDRQPLGIDGGPVTVRSNAGNFPFDTVFLDEPLSSAD